MKVATIRTRIKLGAFVLSVAVIGGLCILLAGDEFNLFKKSRNYQAHFTNTAGLIEGAPVRIGGVKVGSVSRIFIESPNGTLQIVATLRIDDPYYTLVSPNASVALESQGLLGDKYVSLNPGAGTEKSPLAEGEVIATRETEGLGKMVERSSLIVDQVNNTMKKIDAFSSGLPTPEEMQKAATNITDSTNALRLIMTRMSAEDSVLTYISDAQSKQQLRNSLASMEKATAHLDSIVEKIDNGQGTIGALVNDRSLYEDIRSILGHVDRGKIARRVFIEASEGTEKEKSR